MSALRSGVTRMAAGAAAAVLLLGGCAGGAHPGAAAVIGDDEISVERVDEVARAVSAAQGEAMTPTAALQLLISSNLAEQVSAKRSVTVSDAEVAGAMKLVIQDPQVLAKFEADPVAKEFLQGFARGQIGALKLGGAKSISDANAQQAAQAGAQIISDEAKVLGVDVSPRYGRWSGDQLVAVSGSLSTPFKQPTPEGQQPGQDPQQQDPQSPQTPQEPPR